MVDRRGDGAQLRQGDSEIALRLGAGRLEPQRRPILPRGLVRTAQVPERIAQLGVHLGRAGAEPHRPLIMRDGLRQPARPGQCESPIIMGLRIVRIEPHGRGKVTEGAGGISLRLQEVAEIVVGEPGGGIARQRGGPEGFLVVKNRNQPAALRGHSGRDRREARPGGRARAAGEGRRRQPDQAQERQVGEVIGRPRDMEIRHRHEAQDGQQIQDKEAQAEEDVAPPGRAPPPEPAQQ